jgi:hypothetical protein
VLVRRAARPHNVHPDFVVFNPRRGLLVLKVKDWKLPLYCSLVKLLNCIYFDPGPFDFFNTLIFYL